MVTTYGTKNNIYSTALAKNEEIVGHKKEKPSD